MSCACAPGGGRATDRGCVRRGVFATAFIGVVFCAEHMRDTIMIRPHPAFWRFVLGVAMMYMLLLMFILFQARAALRRPCVTD